MKKIIAALAIFLSCASCFSKETKSSMSGKDFYFVNLAYQDMIENEQKIFIQDTQKVNERINHLEELSKRENWNPLDNIQPTEEWKKEFQEYNELQFYLQSSKEDYIKNTFTDLSKYTFDITYSKDTVKVYFYIKSPSVRGGDATYLFDYDGNIIKKDFGL